jgi:hypothetical protein
MDSERRLARTTASDYLCDLDRADTAHVRVMRDECRAEEQRLSYVRRMVQGHLDLAEAELARRRDAGAEALVVRVARTLAGPGGIAPSLRAVGLYEPAGSADDLDDLATARLPDLDDETLLAHVDRLRRRERALSDRRAVLLGHLDRLQAALVDRYRDGLAAIDEAFTLDSC